MFDYGCGRGDDVRQLCSIGVNSTGWDPAFRSSESKRHADVVNLGYVVNVIEDPEERQRVLEDAWRLTRAVLIVSSRLRMDASGVVDPFGDGVITARETFQKYFTQEELREWLENSLNCSAIAAAPGVYFVFRDEAMRQAFLDSRYRRRRAAPRVRKSDILFEENRDRLQALIDFITRSGRLPVAEELQGFHDVTEAFGSVRRAFAVIRRVTGQDQWDRIRIQRHQELLNYLALEKFNGRPRLSDLPLGLQHDIRDFFSSYRTACESADRLLFSVGRTEVVDRAAQGSEIGKLTPTALYVHRSALAELSPVLGVYEGCARAYVGAVEDANVIKLHRREAAISYLSYPGFEKDPHPALQGALHVSLRPLKVGYRDYTASDSPPILHRKEDFVLDDHPTRAKFERLTQQEERWGLYSNPNKIGSRRLWNDLLKSKGVALRGHRVVRMRLDSTT